MDVVHTMTGRDYDLTRAVRQAGEAVGQDCFPSYGTGIRAFEITALETSGYAERELEGSPILGPGSLPWNQSSMHHIDAHLTNNGWLACVDRWRPDPEARS